jgi:hypothetical protein
MINGKCYDWESVEIVIPYKTAIGITNNTYKDLAAGGTALRKGVGPARLCRKKL